MLLEKLVLHNYRNFSDLSLDSIDDKVNIIHGRNAVGKTNLMESISYVSTGKSFRGVNDAKLIRENEKEAFINARYSSRYSKGNVDIKIIGDEKKVIRINSMPIRRISELMGVMNSVVFFPDDLKIIKESPSFRRRMIDTELCKINPSYYTSLLNYNKVLKNKNKVLKDAVIDKNLIDVYNEQLSKYGTEIVEKRRNFIRELNGFGKDFYNNFSDINENLNIIYRSCLTEDEKQDEFRKKLDENMETEIKNRISLFGPHREDLEILINERDSKVFASQGQQRTAILAIKISFLYIAEKMTGERPILLLDDVFSELDDKRKQILMETINNIQAFITCTDPGTVNIKKDANIIHIDDGKIV